MLTKYLSIGMLVISGMLGIQNYYLNQKNNVLIVQLDREQAATQAANKRLEASEKEYKEYYSKYFDLREKNSSLVLELNDSNKKLDDYKRREYVILKKPSLVERRANAATKRLFDEYACITGDSRACKDN